MTDDTGRSSEHGAGWLRSVGPSEPREPGGAVAPWIHGTAAELALSASVRRATAADLAALAELVNRAHAVEAAFVGGDRTDAAELSGLLATGAFVVLEQAGGLAAAVHVDPVGLGGARGGGPPPVGRCGSLGMLSVRRELQGRGLGTRLVRIAEAMCEADGCDAIGLRILNLREELGRWVRWLGYREVGTAPCVGRPVRQPCHLVELRKPLRPIAAAA